MQARAWLNALRDAPRKKPLPVLSFPCVSLLNITVKDLIADSGLQAEGMRRVAERVDALSDQGEETMYQLAIGLALEANARRIAAARILDSLTPEAPPEAREPRKSRKDKGDGS